MRPVLRTSVALLLLLAVACSSDAKDSATKGSTTTTTIKTLAAKEVDAKASPYCATWADIRDLAAPADEQDPAKRAAARKAHYAKVVPLAEKLLGQADAEIKSSVEAALAQAQDLARTGGDTPADPKAVALQQKLAKYALDHCAK